MKALESKKMFSNEKFTVKKVIWWCNVIPQLHFYLTLETLEILWRRNCCTIQIYTDLHRSVHCIWPWKFCNMDWCEAVGLCYNQLPQSEAKCSIKMQLKKVYTKCSKITAGSIKPCNSAGGGFLVQCIGLFQRSGFGASPAQLASIAGTSAPVWLMDHLM